MPDPNKPDRSSPTHSKQTLGYVLEAWPPPCETAVLDEIIALERHGVSLRIFALQDCCDGQPDPRLGRLRATVTCLSARGRWRLALRTNFRMFRAHPAPYVRTIFQMIRHFRWRAPGWFTVAGFLAEIMSHEPIAHLHAHGAGSAALVTVFAHHLTGVPYTCTVRTKDVHDAAPELLRTAVEHAQAVIVCTQSNRRSLLDRISPACYGKLHYVGQGIDAPEFEFRSPRPPGAEPPVVLTVAGLVEEKGLQDLIAAAGILNRRGRSFRLEIVGDSPLAAALAAQVDALGLEGRVRLTGTQPHQEGRRAYHRASIFALPCAVAANGDRDGIPGALLEAMASGAPVVSTLVSAIPELIQSEVDGLLVEPDNPDLLAGALERILTQPELGRRLANSARSRIEANFSLDQSAKRMLALFRQEPVPKRFTWGLENTSRAARYQAQPTGEMRVLETATPLAR